MKKIISLLLAITMLFTLTVYGADETAQVEKIEIAFIVGDSVLQINGKSVEVETPFVEDGVTLVPLRVITEAFGAQVLWEGETQRITLTYEDTTIVLTIDDAVVLVNQSKKQLLAAPKIVNEKTMVPLRFITENFGATVGYDEKTGSITVVKEGLKLPTVKEPTDPKDTTDPQLEVPAQNETLSAADGEGYQTYTNHKMKVSFQIPSGFSQLKDGDNEGEIIFYKYDSAKVLIGMVYLSIYQIAEGTTAADLAKTDITAYNTNDKVKLYSCSDIKVSDELAGLDTRYYTMKFRNAEIKNLFGCNGEYGYTLRYFNNDEKGFPITKMSAVKGLKLDKLDSALVGDLKLWQQVEMVTQKNADFNYWEYSVTVPSGWRKSEDKADSLWMIGKDSLTFTNDKGIKINIVSIKTATKESLDATKIEKVEYKDITNLYASYFDYFLAPIVQRELDKDRLSDPLYITSSPYRQMLTKGNGVDVRYTQDGKIYYMSRYIFYGRVGYYYYVCASVEESLCTPATMVLIDRILQSIEFAPLK